MAKSITLFNKLFLAQHLNIYRIILIIGFIIAISLSLAIPTHMSDPDDWAYYYAVQNFAQGHFTVDSQTHSLQVAEAQQQGGSLIQYVQIGSNTWAFEKAPGYVLYLIPFQWLGLPRWGNVILALSMLIVTYLLLKRLRDEKTAMLGGLLLLFTPLALVMLNRSYMDTYASLAFLVMGGGLYIYYHLQRRQLPGWRGTTLLGMAFFLIGWSVVTRYTNLTVAVVLALHFILTRLLAWRKHQPTGLRSELLPVLLGIGLPLLALLLYDYLIFGSPLDYGYHYTRFDISFAYQYLGQVNQAGQSIPLQIIMANLREAPRALLVGFPLLLAAIPAIGLVLYFNFRTIFKRDASTGLWSSLSRELPWDLILVLLGWIVGVFGLYLMYNWTTEFQWGGSFIIFSRFYLPGLFPLVVLAALLLARLPYKLYLPLMVILVALGSLIYTQWALNLNILPGWLINGASGGRFPGGRSFNNPNDGFRGNFPSNGSPPDFYPGNFPGSGGNYFPRITPGGGFQPPVRN